MPAVSDRPPGRLARALGLDGNPLRRASDRAEAWIRAGLLAAFLVAAPIAALAAGGWAGHVRTAEADARTVQVHAVRAVLLQKAPAPAAPTGAAWSGQVWVPARWSSADGPARTGEVPAPDGSPAGTVVTVWLNASGRVTRPPPEPGLAGALAALAAPAALAAVALTALAALRFTQRFLDRRRLAAWEAAWSAIGPRWTGHRF